MGLNLNIYVGAYLKIDVKKVPAASPYICPEHSGKKFCEAGFCQKCGKALVRGTPQMVMRNVWDLLPDNNDEFFQADMEDKEFLVFLSNEKHTTPDHVYLNESDEIEITPIMIGYHLRNFKINHWMSINKLEIDLNVRSVTIKFGVIQYYN